MLLVNLVLIKGRPICCTCFLCCLKRLPNNRFWWTNQFGTASNYQFIYRYVITYVWYLSTFKFCIIKFCIFKFSTFKFSTFKFSTFTMHISPFIISCYCVSYCKGCIWLSCIVCCKINTNLSATPRVCSGPSTCSKFASINGRPWRLLRFPTSAIAPDELFGH